MLTLSFSAGYDIEDWEGHERYGFNAVIDTQDLAEYYMPAFEACVRDSDVRGIMVCHIKYDSLPCRMLMYCFSVRIML